VIELRVIVLTVSEVEPLMFSYWALISVVPALRAVASPALLIRAMVELEDVHCTCNVRSSVLPSLNAPVAVNCCEPPVPTVEIAGVTVMDTRTAGVTVKDAVVESPAYSAWTVVWPVAIAEAIPFASIPAIVGVKEFQVTPWSNG
jgi:hypothetical protein